jgi:hypothetical protein
VTFPTDPPDTLRAVKVTSPDGQTWRVTRRWVPWRRRLKGSTDLVPDLPAGWGDDGISAVIGFVLLLPFLLLALVTGLEVLVLLVVFPIALLGRVLLGRHWTIELRRGFRPWWEEETGAWSAAGIRIHEVADAVRRGEVPAQTLGTHDS